MAHQNRPGAVESTQGLISRQRDGVSLNDTTRLLPLHSSRQEVAPNFNTGSAAEEGVSAIAEPYSFPDPQFANRDEPLSLLSFEELDTDLSQSSRRSDDNEISQGGFSSSPVPSQATSSAQQHLHEQTQPLNALEGSAAPHSIAAPQNVRNTGNAGTSLARSDVSWLPLTLRWPFLLCVIIASLGLGALVLSLTIYSMKNHGLGNSNPSSILFFGWRFSPTLVAVVYSLLLSSILLAVRRTEPYARLSRDKGIIALNTILFSQDRHWWSDPTAALSRKQNGGKRSWVYFLASWSSILGFLVISPLSSAFIAPATLRVSRPMYYNRLQDIRQNPQKVDADDNTYFRVTSSYLLNVQTSAWITDRYVVSPFWPSNINEIPFGPKLTNQSQDWQGSTLVFQAELKCDSLSFDGIFNVSRPCIYNSAGKPSKSYSNYTKVVLSSSDGCVAEYDAGVKKYPGGDPSMADVGGGWWTNSSMMFPKESCASTGDSMFTNTTFRPGQQSACGADSVLLAQSPLMWNKSNEFEVRGEACRSTFYFANVTASVSSTTAITSVEIDEVSFMRDRKPLNLSDVGLSDFHSSFLSSNWNQRMRSPESEKDEALVVGPLAMLAARHNRNWKDTRTSPDLVRDAQQLHHRFFAERIQSVMKSNLRGDDFRNEGRLTGVESRIVAIPGIGLALGALLLLIAAALLALFFLSRTTRRPLNLSRDPSSAAGTASIIAPEHPEILKIFAGADRDSEPRLRSKLRNFYLEIKGGELRLRAAEPSTISMTGSKAREAPKKIRDWRPTAVKGWAGLALFVLIVIVLASIITLDRLSRTTGLYKKAYTYSLNVPLSTHYITSLTPYSIIPTLLAVSIKLWWGALDTVFKRIQPYISMAQSQVVQSQGLTLSYVSSPLVYSIGKALRHRHGFLALICLGTFLTEVFTVGMSALCEEKPRRISHLQDKLRTFELRTLPHYYEYQTSPPGVRGGAPNPASQVTQHVYGNLLTNWIYGATLQFSLNGAQPAWTAEDWSFVPVELPGPMSGELREGQRSALATNTTDLGPAQNATFGTSALRGRLECSPYTEVLNQSRWLLSHDLTNNSTWNVSANPRDYATGYELKDNPGSNRWTPDYLKLDNGKHATFYAHEATLICCPNKTSDRPEKAAIGYWSKEGGTTSSTGNISVMWTVGYPTERLYYDKNNGTHFIWSEPPRLTGVSCRPIIESAESEVTVAVATKTVQSHAILGNPKSFAGAWHEKYVPRNRSIDSDKPDNIGNHVNDVGYANVTASFGWIFVDALLGSSTLSSVTPDATVARWGNEDLTDRTFNFRMNGINMDFMSYSMWNLANNDVNYLSDASNLARLANKAFSTFFQQFVAANITNGEGGWAYQLVGAKLPSDLGCNITLVPITNERICAPDNSIPASDLPPPTNRTVTITIHERVQSIEFSQAAVWLCTSILGFLGIATVLVFGLYRRHFKALPRDVDSIASVLGFVYGSRKLLAWVRENVGRKDWGQTPSSTTTSFTRSRKQQKYTRPSEQAAALGGEQPMVYMGPFRGKDGQEHWGIEMVDAADDILLNEMSSRIDTSRPLPPLPLPTPSVTVQPPASPVPPTPTRRSPAADWHQGPHT